MKNNKIVLLAILLCHAFSAFSQAYISITNPLAREKLNETIVLKRVQLEQHYSFISNAAALIVKTSNNQIIASQTDDFNGDGNWEELAFQVNLAANETIKLQLIAPDSSNTPFISKKAQVHFAKSALRNNIFEKIYFEKRPWDHQPQSYPMLYQFEGPGWENDIIAFRSYFDSRNGKDVFGKLTTDMVLDSVGLPQKPSYHELQRWGMDVLKVGNSLGAGALAISYNDSLYRLGETAGAAYKCIANGPARAIFLLIYNGMQIENRFIDIIEEISIWGGKNFYTSKVYIKGSNTENLYPTTGVGALYFDGGEIHANFFEPSANYTALAVNNIQSENNDLLAMGILVASSNLHTKGVTPKLGSNNQIINTAYISLNTKDKAACFHFFAGWEKANPLFKTQKLLNKIITAEAENFDNPAIIKFE